MKLDPLTNATVIGDVIKFIETETFAALRELRKKMIHLR
jgi:hypothetical protein